MNGSAQDLAFIILCAICAYLYAREEKKKKE